MTDLKVAPGPSSRHAFRLGMTAAVVAGLAVLGLLHLFDGLSLPLLVFAVVVLFPVYLVFVASALSVWLGYDKDASDLRPVYRERTE